MNKLRAFFYIYTKSIASPKYYFDVLEAKLKLSLKYFVVLSIFGAFIATIASSFVAIPTLKKAIESVATSAKQNYPQDLVITSKDNVWAINKPEPFSIAFPPMEGDGKDTPQNILVFYHNGTVDDIENLSTLILVNEKNILVKESNGFRAYPLQNIPNGQMDRAAFEKMIDQLKTDVRVLPYAVIPLLFLGLIIYFLVFRMIYLLIMAFPIMLIGKALNINLDYTNAVKFATHAITTPITLQLITNILRVDIPVPLWFTIVLFIQTIVVMTQMKKGGQVDTQAATDNKVNS